MRLLRSASASSFRVVFGVVVVCLFGSAAFGQPWDGNGVEGDPYLIYTPADMQAIGGNSNYWNARFKLMADIDLSAYPGTSFNVIGWFVSWDNYKAFTGVFDGNGHTISNFTYTSTGTDYIGVFGYVGGLAEIKDLGLINLNVDGGTAIYVGGLAGIVYGTITNCWIEGGSVSGATNVGGLVGWSSVGVVAYCYSTASVSGTTNVGGLMGHTHGAVSNCYSTGSVSGDDNVGGLVGSDKEASWYGTISNCYSTGSVSGTGNYIGGLVGASGVGVVVSFWDIQTSGQSTSGGGKGKTTAEMQTADTFFGWNGCGSEGVWVLDEGNDYPRLWWENKAGEPLPTESLSDFVAGDGTELNPYLIYTGEQFNLIGLFWCEWDKHFKLMADIDLSAYTGTSFNIIGGGGNVYTTRRFIGVFDGNGHTISNFTYSTTAGYYTGVFGDVGTGAEIKGLGLIDPNVDGGTRGYVGSLVGVNHGIITNCYIEGGSVSGATNVGGLVGGNNYGIVTECYSASSVWGYNYVGGLVGSHSGRITECYSASSVSGNDYVGGLTGYNYLGTITNCYSEGSVWGEQYVGGLTGDNGPGGTITNCSSNASVSGTTNAGGLVGTNAGSGNPAKITNCYSTGIVSATAEVGGLVGSNMPASKVTNSYSTASVTGILYVGGLVGTQLGGSIRNCYSAGSVSGVASVGGLVGYKEAGQVTDSFWDTETSGQDTSAGGVGMPTELMQSALIFTVAGWDFVGESANGTDDFWDICDGTNYPKLAWQIPLLGDFGCPDGVDWADLSVLCGEWLFEELSADVWPDGGDGIVNFLDWAIFAEGWQTTHDIFDLAEFADQWLKTGSNYLIADIAPPADGDGIVNMLDFAALAQNWLAGLGD